MNAGDFCYLENGQRVEYAGKIGGQHFVRFLYTTTTREAGGEEWASETMTPVKKVFEEEPVEIWGDQITKLQATAQSLLQQKLALEVEIKGIEKQKKELMEATKSLPDVATALDFHAGLITHVVVYDYSGYNIQPFKTFLENKDERGRFEGLKLVCLFGKNANKETRWKMNRYNDGSGTWAEFVPFKSLESAESYVRGKFEEAILIWRAGNVGDIHKFGKCNMVLDYPADWIAAQDKGRAERKAAEIATLKTKLAELEGTK